MDLSPVSKLQNKPLMADFALYFSVSLLLASIICYFAFSTKIYFQKKDLADLDAKLANFAIQQQKDQENTVFQYQKKINDFANLLKGHKNYSNVFAFFEKYTLPNVWFYKFGVAEDNTVKLSGECENVETLSRQVSFLEKNQFVEKISFLSSGVGTSGKIDFVLNIAFKPEILNPNDNQ